MTTRIKDCLLKIPRGRVSTYGAVARAADMPNGARQVVRVLHSSPESELLPWHRVLRKDGTIALPRGGGFELQKALLQAEAIYVDDAGRVDLLRYGFDFLEQALRPAARTSPRKKQTPR